MGVGWAFLIRTLLLPFAPFSWHGVLNDGRKMASKVPSPYPNQFCTTYLLSRVKFRVGMHSIFLSSRNPSTTSSDAPTPLTWIIEALPKTLIVVFTPTDKPFRCSCHAAFFNENTVREIITRSNLVYVPTVGHRNKRYKSLLYQQGVEGVTKDKVRCEEKGGPCATYIINPRVRKIVSQTASAKLKGPVKTTENCSGSSHPSSSSSRLPPWWDLE
jgi:hypothetical protein